MYAGRPAPSQVQRGKCASSQSWKGGGAPGAGTWTRSPFLPGRGRPQHPAGRGAGRSTAALACCLSPVVAVGPGSPQPVTEPGGTLGHACGGMPRPVLRQEAGPRPTREPNHVKPIYEECQGLESDPARVCPPPSWARLFGPRRAVCPLCRGLAVHPSRDRGGPPCREHGSSAPARRG